MLKLVSIFIVLTTFSSFASELFTVQKSYNPNNVLHYKANIEKCALRTPSVDSYWIMGETDGHREVLSPKEVRYFAPKISLESEYEALFSIGALEVIGKDFPNKNIQIRMEGCEAKAYAEINGQYLQLKNIYVAGRITITLNWITYYMIVTAIDAAGVEQTFKFVP
ncbi:MAG: DUF4833 domain-containing protein [Bacteriovoracaceae bacterium]